MSERQYGEEKNHNKTTSVTLAVQNGVEDALAMSRNLIWTFDVENCNLLGIQAQFMCKR